jgi:hypothetical protein
MSATDVAEWEAFLDEALRISESAADKYRRLLQLQRDMLAAGLPPEADRLVDRAEAAMHGLCAAQR